MTKENLSYLIVFLVFASAAWLMFYEWNEITSILANLSRLKGLLE